MEHYGLTDLSQTTPGFLTAEGEPGASRYFRVAAEMAP